MARGNSIVVETVSGIVGTQNAWRLADDGDGSATRHKVRLEIQGGRKTGYHLVIAPEGFFAADHWYATQQDAIADAEALFGVSAEEWAPIER